MNRVNPVGEIHQKQAQSKNVPGTDVLTVSYKSTDPQTAAVVINQLMSVYIENNILTNRTEAVRAGEFIAMQLPRTEASVRQAEVALRQFKEQNHVVALDEEAKSAVAVIQELEQNCRNSSCTLRCKYPLGKSPKQSRHGFL
jgi:uncharacterized protein involved in exopolysaccharide biosynthesis